MSVRPGDEDYEEERRRSLVEEDQAAHAEDDDEPEDDDGEFDDDGCIRAKWLIDGSTTLAEAAEKLEAEAARLRELHAEGWTLTEPIADDYGFLRRPS